MADKTEGNAEEALDAFGGDTSFKSLNHEKGPSWKTEGSNDEAAIGEFGGVTNGGKTSSIKSHQTSVDVDTPGATKVGSD